MDDLVFCTATELARIIREKAASASEVLEAHLSHIAKHNPSLNAIVTLNEEAARKRAQEADDALVRGKVWGPLHGVPVTIKDVYETAGLRTTSSFKPLANHVPQQDATVVARLRAGGAVILGKTNMPTLALDIQSNSPLFGPANNPYDVSRTPGGSTGGGAAAIAAGLSTLEAGSDIGGSLRIPASYCGVFSFKPTEHRVSGAGHIPPVPGAPNGVRHMGTFGPVGRSIEDLRLALTLIAGSDERDWEVPPVPLSSVSRQPLPEYRFAWSKGFPGVPVSQETQAAIERVAKALADAGCKVEQVDPPGFDFEIARQAWGTILGSEVGAGSPPIVRFMTALQFRMMADKSTCKRSFARGLAANMPRYVQALTQRDALIASLEKFLAHWDTWLCPVTSGPAFTHRKTGQPIEVDGKKEHYFAATVGHTCVFNLTGSPVAVLPIGRTKEGLPIGMQVVGRRWQDIKVLTAAEALTQVTGAFQRPPGF
jgi:amidase